MTVNIYRSSDPGAPGYTGAAGSVNAVLKACLVTGYGTKSGAGWTNPFSDGLIEVFRMGGGNKRYLRVDDSMPTATSPFAAYIRGYEVMASANEGVNPFPNAAQEALGLSFPRNAGSAATAGKEWQLFASEKLFFFIAATSYTDPFVYPQHFFFGDFVSYVPGDTFNTIICGNPSNAGYSTSLTVLSLTASIASIDTGHYVCRKFDQGGISTRVGKHTDYAKSPAGLMGTAGMNYPAPMDGGLYLAPVYIHEYVSNAGLVRGVMPGIWNPCHVSSSFRNHDTVDGAGAMAGRKFEFLTASNNQNGPVAAYEISDTW